MPDLFPLHLFPEGALASSVITTVWVGIFVVAFFNLRLGWVLSGLVVPGYLVPLLLLKPTAAMVVLGEGVITYALVWFYSEFLSRQFGWSNFFGRDRFFALVLTSVIVRIICDGWLLPTLGEYLNTTWQLQFDYQNNLHSFGLIIVSLIANNFWKTGFRQGLIPLIATVGITYLLVRFVLMEATNFSVSNIGYLYEDMAASILASPKAYIILLTTAFVASRMNLFYGWDFSGILIPSLLALQWYQPEKILVSFIEAFVVLAFARLALRMPVFQHVTIEGARKILLFFNISFAYKIALAYILLWAWPDLKVTDYYGFGYVLPTLMAIKMHDKDIIARLSRATLQTSITAALTATLIGFLLTLFPNQWRGLLTQATNRPIVRPITTTGGVIDQLRQDKISLYRTRGRELVLAPTPGEMEAFSTAVQRLSTLRKMPTDDEAAQIATLLAAANYRLEIREGRYLMLREIEPRKHRGTFIVNPAASSNLVIEVPAPLDERGGVEAGAWIFRNHDARALAVAGSARRANKDGSSDVLVSPNTVYQAFHHAFAVRNVVQVRTYTTETARLLGGSRRDSQSIEIEEPPSAARVKGELPEDFSLIRLKSLIDHFEIAWQPIPVTNLQRETMSSGFVELILNHDDVRKVLARGLAAERNIRLEVLDHSIDGYLQEWLLADKNRIAAAGSNLYQAPRPEDLLYLDDEVLSPLIAAMRRHYGAQGWSDSGLEELKLINLAASVVGYELVRYRHRASGVDYLILAEINAKTGRRYWGTYVFRLGDSQPFIVQAPRPLFEVNSFEVAVSLFERLRAQALMIGGAHPEANQDHSADVLRLQNQANVFNLGHQVILREAGDRSLLSIQSRVLGARPDTPLPTADILISFASGLMDADKATPLGRKLLNTLERSGLIFQFAGGSIEAAGYDAAGVSQAHYLGASQNKEFAVVWVSPLARNEYRQQTEPTPQATQFAALHIASRYADLARELATRPAAPTKIPASLEQQVNTYLMRQDIVVLNDIIRRNTDYRFERIVDVNSRQGYLLIMDKHDRWVGVASLSSRQASRVQIFDRQRNVLQQTLDFIETNAAWLTVDNAP